MCGIFVSIPFIAGQWSLLARDHVLDDRPQFQSPSLRGSGRFRSRASGPTLTGSKFQSPSLRGSGRFPKQCPAFAGMGGQFQSPSLRGSGRFIIKLAAGWDGSPKFQSPSLRGSGRFRWNRASRPKRRPSFNPLHCGAVVASGKPGYPPINGRKKNVSIPFIAGQWSLPVERADEPTIVRVSIPFIAGQWSLHAPPLPSVPPLPAGFNPLHCGAVVASVVRMAVRMANAMFQSPSLRGSGRFPLAARRGRAREEKVSIPFIAGQWSLRPSANLTPRRC